MADVRLVARVSGRVQGVGFRDWVRRHAEGLSGSATNLPDGRVEVVVEGDRRDVDTLLAALRSGSTPGSVTEVSESWAEPVGEPPGVRSG